MSSTIRPRWQRQVARKAAIGGTLDRAALAKLHFLALDPSEQAATLRRLTAAGHSADVLARVTGLDVDAVHRLLQGENLGHPDGKDAPA